ncbi:glycosyltransferase family 2 protein [Promicromonospora sp. NPDC050262]|uniref:glycosyltransferase family 2 protein n=1 Tax=Promicromonospora sp. NPDC050262 TaxID=3155036 RepID=UPI003405B730
MGPAPGDTPRVSVVLPTYNREATLGAAIATVLDQTVPVHELLVVDDGSTDGTAPLVGAFAAHDPRVRYVSQANSGATAARNRGILEATGDVIAFQDSDDLWRPTFVEKLLPHVGPDTLVFGSHVLHDLDGSRRTVPPRHVVAPGTVLRRGNVASTQTMVADAALLARVRFDPGLRRFQDWDLCLTVLETAGARIVHVPDVVADVRRRADSISAGSAAVRDQAVRAVFRKHRRQFLGDPTALARVLLRGWVRPTIRPAVRDAP